MPKKATKVMTKTETTFPQLSKNSLKAVTALFIHLKEQAKSNESLPNLFTELEDDEVDDQNSTSTSSKLSTLPVKVSMIISSYKIAGKPRNKPIRIGPLPNPLFQEALHSNICLITKDPASKTAQLLKKHNITFINKVISLKTFKAKYMTFESRRNLVAAFDLFLVDDALLHVLPAVIGKAFFRVKKQPIPVRITDAPELKYRLQIASSCTSLFISNGSCFNIQIGWTDFRKTQLIENIEKVCSQLDVKLPGGIKNIKDIYIKSTDSPSLPIFSSEAHPGMESIRKKRESPDTATPEDVKVSAPKKRKRKSKK